MMTLEMKVAMVFNKDGLSEEGVKQEIESRGLTVAEIVDGSQVGDDEVKLFLVNGDFSKMFRLKLDYHCWEHPNNEYIWYPMGNTTWEEEQMYRSKLKEARQS